MANKSLNNYKEELKWLEETPFYIGRDGMPNLALILFIIISGLLIGLIIVLTYRYFRKEYLKEKIKELSL